MKAFRSEEGEVTKKQGRELADSVKTSGGSNKYKEN
jgi:hypothetical protein